MASSINENPFAQARQCTVTRTNFGNRRCAANANNSRTAADVTKCVAPPRLTATLPVWYGSEALLADSGRYLQRRGGSVWCVVEIVVP